MCVSPTAGTRAEEVRPGERRARWRGLPDTEGSEGATWRYFEGKAARLEGWAPQLRQRGEKTPRAEHLVCRGQSWSRLADLV